MHRKGESDVEARGDMGDDEGNLQPGWGEQTALPISGFPYFQQTLSLKL